MIERIIESSSASQEDQPWGLNWATDPVDGDPYFNWNWDPSGTSITPYGNSGDLNTLMSMLEAMKNNDGAGDNLQDILAFVIKMAKADKNDPATLAFFQQNGGLFKQVMEAELLLVYSQSIGTPPDPTKAYAGMMAFIHSLTGPGGPLAGASASDPIVGPIVAALNEYSDPTAEATLQNDFWDMKGSAPVFQLYSSDEGGPSEDGHAINLMGSDGQEIFAEYIFKDVLYDNTFGPGAKYANATNELFKTMFDQLYGATKGNPMLALIILMVLLGNMKDNSYHDTLQGYAYSTNWLTKHQNDLQKLLNEYNTSGYFKDSPAHAKEWMDNLRRLFIDAEFNPYADSLKGNIEEAYSTIFNNPVTGTSPYPMSNDYWSGNYTNLALDLNSLSQGQTTVIPDQFQVLTKQFTDRSQAIQTEMSQVSNNDNTIVNTLKTFLGGVTQLVQATNQAMSKA